jgi:predicted Zn-dependent peptidase
MASAAFSDLPADQTFEEAAAKCTPSETRDERQLEQAHIVLGFESMSRTDEHYYSAQALAGILGGGMSSRLFREVREKRGLAYSVYAYNQVLKDTGQMCFYAGTGPKDVSELMPVLCDEILKVQHDLKDEEIARAKTQLKSNLLMARESMMTRADQHAKYLLQRDKVFDQDEVVKNIEAINRDSLQAAAKIIFSKKPTLSAVGPLASLMSYDDIAAKCAA